MALPVMRGEPSSYCGPRTASDGRYPFNQTVLGAPKDRAKVRALQTDLVFPSQAQTPLERSHLRRAFRDALKQTRIEDCRFHDLEPTAG
jgi:integrase